MFLLFLQLYNRLSCMMQRDTTGMTSENSDLKIRVQTMEQQVQLQDGKFFYIVLFAFKVNRFKF
jgi:hypothetical protein